MGQIKVQCVEQTISFLNTPIISSGNVNYDSIEFTFCHHWTDFIKTAIFYRSKNEVYYQLLDENDTCVIPKEVLTEKGTFYFGVFGVLNDVRLTSQIMSYRIQEGAIVENLTPADPTPDIYDQILSVFNDFTLELTDQQNQLNYFKELFEGSLGDAEKLGGHSPDYFATAQSVTDIIEGTTPVKKATDSVNAETATTAEKSTDSEKLGGRAPDYYAPKQSVENVIDGTTPVAKATSSDNSGDSEKLGGELPEAYSKKTDLVDYLLSSGGSVSGNLAVGGNLTVGGNTVLHSGNSAKVIISESPLTETNAIRVW